MWSYKTSDETEGYPIIGGVTMYGGGGYVAELGSNVEQALAVIAELADNRWIDKYTRAVICEFVVWNPNINLFAISTSLVEFPPSGGKKSRFKINMKIRTNIIAICN